MSLPLRADPIDDQHKVRAIFLDPAACGVHYSPDVRRTLARCFPEVSVRWNVQRRRFWLVQTTREGRLVPFRELGTQETPAEPTIENTALFVAELAAIRTAKDKQRWLERIDGTAGQAEMEKDARERIRQGARDLYPHLFGHRVMVTRDLGGLSDRENLYRQMQPRPRRKRKR